MGLRRSTTEILWSNGVREEGKRFEAAGREELRLISSAPLLPACAHGTGRKGLVKRT